MHVYIYARKQDGMWRWAVSLDVKVDIAFWQERDPQISFVFVEQALPVPVAMEMVQRGNQRAEPVLPGRLPLTEWKPIQRQANSNPIPYAKISALPAATLIEKVASALQGRLLLPDELLALLKDRQIDVDERNWRTVIQAACLTKGVKVIAGIARAPEPSKRLRCQRCGSGEDAMEWTHCGRCGQKCAYCCACLALGKIRACSLLMDGSAVRTGKRTEAPDNVEAPDNAVPIFPSSEELHSIRKRWSLSPLQAQATAQALAFIRQRKTNVSERLPDSFLIWAVTGAGKTEMVFPLIEHEWQCGGRILMATPRKDVVLELYPRLMKSFPHIRIVALYGGSPERWRHGDLVLSTTHQLLRFRHAFDLVIVDEVDAFPYHNNPMLIRAARRACRPEGRFIFLSATPPESMQRDIRCGKIGHVIVPARFHGHPLPVPVIRCRRFETQRMRLLVNELAQSVRRGAQSFVFVPRIGQVDPLVRKLRERLPGVSIDGTSSRDAEREPKVLAFRDRQIRVLVTTTILERGVTVPRSDVYVYDADAALFDEAALVQMAGRAGRSADDPKGKVFFISRSKTRAQTGAVRMIRKMNRLAAVVAKGKGKS